MGMDLRGAGGATRFGVTFWGNAFELALKHGWEPAGTLPPKIVGEPEDLYWDGSYFWNNYQRVTAADAAAWAEALERSLPDIPDHEVIGVDVDDMSPAEWFGGAEGKDYLREFIAYCRAGAFMIG